MLKIFVVWRGPHGGSRKRIIWLIFIEEKSLREGTDSADNVFKVVDDEKIMAKAKAATLFGSGGKNDVFWVQDVY